MAAAGGCAALAIRAPRAPERDDLMQHPVQWGVAQLSHYLGFRAGLPQDITRAFEDNLVNGLIATSLCDEDLRVMGISHALRRRRVLTELQQLFARANGAAGDGDTEAAKGAPLAPLPAHGGDVAALERAMAAMDRAMAPAPRAPAARPQSARRPQSPYDAASGPASSLARRRAAHQALLQAKPRHQMTSTPRNWVAAPPVSRPTSARQRPSSARAARPVRPQSAGSSSVTTPRGPGGGGGFLETLEVNNQGSPAVPEWLMPGTRRRPPVAEVGCPKDYEESVLEGGQSIQAPWTPRQGLGPPGAGASLRKASAPAARAGASDPQEALQRAPPQAPQQPEAQARLAQMRCERKKLRDQLVGYKKKLQEASEHGDKKLAKVYAERDELQRKLHDAWKRCDKETKKGDRLRDRLREAAPQGGADEEYDPRFGMMGAAGLRQPGAIVVQDPQDGSGPWVLDASQLPAGGRPVRIPCRAAQASY